MSAERPEGYKAPVYWPDGDEVSACLASLVQRGFFLIEVRGYAETNIDSLSDDFGLVDADDEGLPLDTRIAYVFTDSRLSGEKLRCDVDFLAQNLGYAYPTNPPSWTEAERGAGRELLGHGDELHEESWNLETCIVVSSVPFPEDYRRFQCCDPWRLDISNAPSDRPQGDPRWHWEIWQGRMRNPRER